MSGGSGTGTPVTIPGAVPATAFETMLAADLSSVFFNAAEFAVAATYTPKGGLATPITICFADEDLASTTPQPPGDEMVILVRYSEVAAPLQGDKFTIRSVDWNLKGVLAGGREEGIWHIAVTRSVRRSIGGGGRV
jgi:hypothetical protein